MKKLIVFGAAGILSLAIGASASAADFSGKQTGRMAGHHIFMSAEMTENYVKPAFSMMAAGYGAGNCGLVCNNWSKYCGNFADIDNDGVCDNYIDTDNNGVCDNWQGGGYRNGYGNGGGSGHHFGGHGRGCHNW